LGVVCNTGFFGQLPHFLGDSLVYRDESAKAGFQKSAGVDPMGPALTTSRETHTLCLCRSVRVRFCSNLTVTSSLPEHWRWELLVWLAIQLQALRLHVAAAILLFDYLYLPLLLSLMVIDKIKLMDVGMKIAKYLTQARRAKRVAASLCRRTPTDGTYSRCAHTHTEPFSKYDRPKKGK